MQLALASNLSNISYIRHTEILTPACKIVSFETLWINTSSVRQAPDSKLHLQHSWATLLDF
jgi:hypothetical protein